MQIRVALKKTIERLPASISRPLSRVPFTFRFGYPYLHACREIELYERLSSDERNAKILHRLKSIVLYAYEYVPFYRELYHEHGFHPKDINELSDWNCVPVVTKDELQQIPLDRRTGTSGMRINTGGTSGQPLVFFVDHQAFAREWASIHHIWKARGYHTNHVKLTFRGKHFDMANALRYNAVHNEYIVNSNCSMEDVITAVAEVTNKTPIRWIHGYPSLVAEFADYISRDHTDFGALLGEHLFGVLLGSEYPADIYREKIELTLSTNIVSWYGHSEMAVLARETTRGVYTSLSTYGYAEALQSDNDENSSCRLLCTSFKNRAHPFIRYDTGDLITPLWNVGGSLAFKVTEGRVGDFVIARDGRRISLTSIIFGRHHPCFSRLQHIQVRQDAPGSMTLLVVPIRTDLLVETLRYGFDFDGLGIDWSIEIINAPIRTASGKIQLVVNVNK